MTETPFAVTPVGDTNTPSDPATPVEPPPTFTLAPPVITQPNTNSSIPSMGVVLAGTTPAPGLVSVYDGDYTIGTYQASDAFWYVPVMGLKKGKHTFTANLRTMGYTSGFSAPVVVTITVG